MLSKFAIALSVILSLTMVWMPTAAAQRGYHGTVNKNLSPVDHAKPRRVKKNDDEEESFDVVLNVTVASGVPDAQTNAGSLGVVLRSGNQEYYGGIDGSFAQGATVSVTLSDVPFSAIDSLRLYTLASNGVNLVGGTLEVVGVLDAVLLKFSAWGFDGVGIWLDNPVQEIATDAGRVSTCWEVCVDEPAKFCNLP